mmetsp:Transcript_21338/g.32655  ORF Transcript_21338/g.32655 Transcript_21338/m.32655 type:complete len:80 (+) Transcript_21338:80-319(+)
MFFHQTTNFPVILILNKNTEETVCYRNSQMWYTSYYALDDFCTNETTPESQIQDHVHHKATLSHFSKMRETMFSFVGIF